MINKAALMRSASRTTGLSLRDTAACIDSVVETINDAISRGERIELRGFGTFSVKQVSTKNYPTSFTQKTVPAHGRIVFRPSQRLKKSVWDKIGGT